MPYLTPAIPLTSVSAQTLRRLGYTPPRRMRGRYVRTRQGMQWLGAAAKSSAPKIMAERFVAPAAQGATSSATPTPATTTSRFVTPGSGGTSSTAAATAAAASNPTVQSGYCVFTSSPETGGVTSVAQCSAAPGGVPIQTGTAESPYATNAAPTSSVSSPVPSTWPTNQPYTDSYGNIWTYSSYYGWQITGSVSGIENEGTTGELTAQQVAAESASGGYFSSNGQSVQGNQLAPPSNFPINLTYISSNGSVWNFNPRAGVWQSSNANGIAAPQSQMLTTADTGEEYSTGYYGASGSSTAPPSTWPTTEPYTDSNGNVWTYSAATGWQITSNVYGANALQATGASVVPSNWPTNEPYTDASGNVWTYTGNGWQISQYGTGTNPYTSAAAEQTAAVSAQGANTAAGSPGTNVSVGGAAASPGPYDSIVNWLGEQTLIPGMSNGMILLIAGVGIFLLKGKR